MIRRCSSWPGASLLLGLLIVAQVPASALGAGGYYERFVEPKPMSRQELKLLSVVRRFGRAHEQALRYDARLARAAAAMLDLVPTARDVPLPHAKVRLAVARFGCTDGQVAAVGLRTPDADATATLQQQLEAELATLELNRFGLAAERRGNHTVVVAIFSRRMLNLLPFAPRIRPKRGLSLAGALPPAFADATLELVLGLPAGNVRRLPLVLASNSRNFEVQINSNELGESGMVDAQVLLDRGHGPEIAASFILTLAGPPMPGAENALALPLPNVDGGDTPSACVAEGVLDLRSSQGLPLPTLDERLSEVARSHAQDMLRQGFFAHTSPTTGDVTERLHSRGVHFARALENIAAVAEVDDAFAAWLASPSHRQNLLDEAVTQFGVGVAEEETPPGRLFIVVVLARPGDDGAAHELTRRARAAINRVRGKKALLADDRLDVIARRHSEEMAKTGLLSDVSPRRGPLLDTVLRELLVAEAALDVFRAESVDVITRSPHARASFSHVGVGVTRKPSQDGPELWITVIYARD